uniref:BTB domain-containing protein n=1 Tax=Caenorhabditis tropicalis TaxID=1561998 RepID=A0A1I7UKS5_9PELO
MSNRHKYAFNGEGFFENAREHIERNDFPRIPIGTIGGVDGWYLRIIQTVQNNVTYYSPFIGKPGPHPKIRIRYYFVIFKKDGSVIPAGEGYYYLDSGYGYQGNGRTVTEFLDEEKGYLTNGGIKIEYGLQIEGSLDPYNFWTFNFHDRLFDYIFLFQFLEYAQKYKLFNVIKLIDQIWITMDIKINLSTALSHGLNHYLANFLDKQKTLRELAKKLKNEDLEKMSGEAMKKCVKRFFELAIPNGNCC